MDLEYNMAQLKFVQNGYGLGAINDQNTPKRAREFPPQLKYPTCTPTLNYQQQSVCKLALQVEYVNVIALHRFQQPAQGNGIRTYACDCLWLGNRRVNQPCLNYGRICVPNAIWAQRFGATDSLLSRNCSQERRNIDSACC